MLGRNVLLFLFKSTFWEEWMNEDSEDKPLFVVENKQTIKSLVGI